MQEIERIRIEKGITVTSFMEDVGVTRTTYYKWVTGVRKPKAEYVYRMCRILELDFEEIFEKYFLKK